MAVPHISLLILFCILTVSPGCCRIWHLWPECVAPASCCSFSSAFWPSVLAVAAGRSRVRCCRWWCCRCIWRSVPPTSADSTARAKCTWRPPPSLPAANVSTVRPSSPLPYTTVCGCSLSYSCPLCIGIAYGMLQASPIMGLLFELKTTSCFLARLTCVKIYIVSLPESQCQFFVFWDQCQFSESFDVSVSFVSFLSFSFSFLFLPCPPRRGALCQFTYWNVPILPI